MELIKPEIDLEDALKEPEYSYREAEKIRRIKYKADVPSQSRLAAEPFSSEDEAMAFATSAMKKALDEAW